jgi:hypothetical protein
MRFKFSYIILLLCGLVLLSETSCRKERILNSGGQLEYSTDTLTFDTVFTAQGSFTNQFKIYNPQSQRVKISSIRLQGGDNSYFSLNVDGTKGKSVQDIEIAPHDSIFVFATVNIDPTNDNIPFVVEDKVIATMNGTNYELPLVAYGQNAYYIYDSVLSTQTWLTDKPYIIINNAAVDLGQTLTIPAGARIYMHANSNLYVLGTLKINGTKTDSVIFQGDRLDRAYFGYEGYPGEWGGLLFFGSSHGNVLDYAILKNCGNGSGGTSAAIYAQTDDSGTADVVLKHIIVENSFGYALLGNTGIVSAENCLFHSTGSSAVAIIRGGQYNFTNCTFANFGVGNVSHTDNATVVVLNYVKVGDNQFEVGPLQQTFFTNCVIWGSLDNELVVDKLDNAAYELTFDHCLIKKNTTEDPIPDYVTQVDNLINQDPNFVDYSKFDYHLQGGSPAIDKGKDIQGGFSPDLDNKTWTQPFDIGCFQY